MKELRSLGLTKEEFAQKAYDLAYHKEATGGCCPQAVLGALQELLDLKNVQVLQSACAFAGGIAHQCLTCGALLGGIMVLSLKYGRGINMEDYDAGVKAMELSNKLMLKFKNEFGTLNCGDITGLKASTTLEEFKNWRQSGVHDELCPVVCGKTARMVAEIISERAEEIGFHPSKLRKFWIDL